MLFKEAKSEFLVTYCWKHSRLMQAKYASVSLRLLIFFILLSPPPPPSTTYFSTLHFWAKQEDYNLFLKIFFLLVMFISLYTLPLISEITLIHFNLLKSLGPIYLKSYLLIRFPDSWQSSYLFLLWIHVAISLYLSHDTDLSPSYGIVYKSINSSYTYSALHALSTWYRILHTQELVS